MNTDKIYGIFADISAKLIENGIIKLEDVKNKKQQLRVRKVLDANKAAKMDVNAEAVVTEEAKPVSVEKEVKEVE